MASKTSVPLRLSLEILLVLALAGGAVVAARSILARGAPSLAWDALEVAGFALLAGALLVRRIASARREESRTAPTSGVSETAPRRSDSTAKLIDTAARRLAEAEQAAALDVTTALARAKDVSEAAEAVNDALERTTGLARTAVLLFQEDGVCRFVGWRGLSTEYRRAVEGHCPWERHASDAEPIVVADARAEPSLAAYHELLAREDIAALAFVPVMAKAGLVGKLMLYSGTPGGITASNVRSAAVVAVSLGAAITRLRMGDALARSESRLRAVIDTAMDAVVSMDCRGLVTGWNAQAESTFGWTAAEVQGRPLHELIIPEDLRPLHQRGLAHYLETGASLVLGKRIEVPAVRKDGKRITVELAITPVHTADGVLFSGFLRDITEQKRAADELIEARSAAEAANRAKSEFLANMSHEIRTPLTAILGYAELLRDDGDIDRAPERRLETIETIRGAGQHLLTIINDILDISKIEAGKVVVETVETALLSILQEVEGLMRPRALDKGVELTTRLASPLPEIIRSDPTRLRQILVNLVGNAVKFTERGSIAILARSEERDGVQRLVIDVEDTGPGLSSTQSARIFSPFGQADASVTRRHGGSGLGLTISHRLAQLLGGAVTLARTQVGRGSCFRVDVPLVAVDGAALVARLESPTVRQPTRPAAHAQRLSGRVLLAEDGRDNQFLIAFFLRRAGAEVDVANNGRTALAMIESGESSGRPYDLLLTDIQMPEMDGYTLTAELRKRGSRLAIIALTAHALAEDRQKCFDVGCDGYAVKPIDKTRLLATCAEWMGKPGGAGARAA